MVKGEEENYFLVVFFLGDFSGSESLVVFFFVSVFLVVVVVFFAGDVDLFLGSGSGNLIFFDLGGVFPLFLSSNLSLLLVGSSSFQLFPFGTFSSLTVKDCFSLMKISFSTPSLRAAYRVGKRKNC